MEKLNLNKQFAFRLREAMLASGFHSKRSVSGVSVHKLVEMTGYSLQICRKYLRGEAIPEPVKLVELAEKLNVSAGWLLFGDARVSSASSKLLISRNLLHYILMKARCLYNDAVLEQEVPNFLMELIDDVSFINATEEQSKKIIDLAFSSAQHFNKLTKDLR